MSKNHKSEQTLAEVSGNGRENGRLLSYQGPLPLANEIEKYEQVSPGSADRIIKMAENQQGHRHRIEDRTVWFMGVQSLFAPVFAFLTIIFGMGIGAYLLLNGVTGAGVAAMFIPLATVAGIFILQRNAKEIEE